VALAAWAAVTVAMVLAIRTKKSPVAAP